MALGDAPQQGQVAIGTFLELWFVTFVDHGTVESDVSIRDYRVSVGAGLRVVVPALGPLPIALDFAYPLTKSPFDQKQIFSFYVGWFGGQ